MFESSLKRSQFVAVIGSLIGTGVGSVLAAETLFGYHIVGPWIQNLNDGRDSSNENLALQLGLASRHPLRPVPASYRTKAEGVFADGTVLVGRSTPRDREPTIRVAWSYQDSLVRPEPFPLGLVKFGAADDGVRRTVRFDLRYTDKALSGLLAEIAASNTAARAEALAHLQDYCSTVILGLRPGEQETITRFLQRV